ncbi:hypothetical protein ACMFMF_005593 [Clarireedia jacksonii]
MSIISHQLPIEIPTYSDLRRRTDDVVSRGEEDCENPSIENALNEEPVQQGDSHTEAQRPDGDGEVFPEYPERRSATGYMGYKALGEDGVGSASNQDKPLEFAGRGDSSTPPPPPLPPPGDHYTLFGKFLQEEFEKDDGEESTSEYSQSKDFLYHDRRPDEFQSNTLLNADGRKANIEATGTPTRIGINPDYSVWRPVFAILKHEKTGEPVARIREDIRAHSRFSIHCRIDEMVLKDLDILITNHLKGSCELNEARSKITILKGLPAQHWRTYQTVVRLLCSWKSGIALGVASPFVAALGSDRHSTYTLGLVLHDDSGLTFYRDSIRRAIELDFNDYQASMKNVNLTTGLIVCRGLKELDAKALMKAIKVAYPGGIDLGVSTRCFLQHTLSSTGRNRTVITDSPEFLMMGRDPHTVPPNPRREQIEDLWTVTMMEAEDPTIPPDYGAYRFRSARHLRLKKFRQQKKEEFRERHQEELREKFRGKRQELREKRKGRKDDAEFNWG